MLLDGKAVSKLILEDVKSKIKLLDKKPHLAVIMVGDDEPSKIYVNNKMKAAEFVGAKSTVYRFSASVSEDEVVSCINKLNTDDDISAILVQMPLPEHINKFNIISAIEPKKDIDCFTPENVGRLSIGLKPYFYPVTPQGVIMLLKHYNIELKGKHVAVIGRSNIVGKPMVQMLLRENATVSVCHSYTRSDDLENIIKTADIIISAVGKKIVRCKMVKYKSIFVDVGISRDTNGKLTGDLNWEIDFNDFDDVLSYFEYVSPVPGGVGPMTIASLLFNLLT